MDECTPQGKSYRVSFDVTVGKVDFGAYQVCTEEDLVAVWKSLHPKEDEDGEDDEDDEDCDDEDE